VLLLDVTVCGPVEARVCVSVAWRSSVV